MFYPQYFSSSATMDLKVFLVFTMYVFLMFAKESLSHSTNNLGTRFRRSPQRENLSHCNSAFLNFAKFKQRGCPPPKFCTLSRPLKLRYCTKGPGTGVFQQFNVFIITKTCGNINYLYEIIQRFLFEIMTLMICFKFVLSM